MQLCGIENLPVRAIKYVLPYHKISLEVSDVGPPPPAMHKAAGGLRCRGPAFCSLVQKSFLGGMSLETTRKYTSSYGVLAGEPLNVLVTPMLQVQFTKP